MGRFWPSALVERGEGGGISATKRGNEVISSTGNAELIVLITESILVETNTLLLLGVLFPVLLGGGATRALSGAVNPTGTRQQ